MTAAPERPMVEAEQVCKAKAPEAEQAGGQRGTPADLAKGADRITALWLHRHRPGTRGREVGGGRGMSHFSSSSKTGRV